MIYFNSILSYSFVLKDISVGALQKDLYKTGTFIFLYCLLIKAVNPDLTQQVECAAVVRLTPAGVLRGYRDVPGSIPGVGTILKTQSNDQVV